MPEEHPRLPPAVLGNVLAIGDEEPRGCGVVREVGPRTRGRGDPAPGPLPRSPRRMQGTGPVEGPVEGSEERPDPGLDGGRRP